MAPRQQSTPIVLLVHPADDSRDMYAEFLRHHGFAPQCTADVAEAVSRASTASVIVTELHLPATGDGCDFISRLRSQDGTRNKPVIVLTSWAWQTDKLRANDAGCDLFLTKPCLPNVLLRHVRRLLISPPSAPASSDKPATGVPPKRQRKRTA